MLSTVWMCDGCGKEAKRKEFEFEFGEIKVEKPSDWMLTEFGCLCEECSEKYQNIVNEFTKARKKEKSTVVYQIQEKEEIAMCKNCKCWDEKKFVGNGYITTDCIFRTGIMSGEDYCTKWKPKDGERNE